MDPRKRKQHRHDEHGPLPDVQERREQQDRSADRGSGGMTGGGNRTVRESELER